VVYKAIRAKKLYNVKSSKRDNKKPEKAFLPIVKEANDITIYGDIYPIRKFIVLDPTYILFEMGSPDAYGYHLIENRVKGLIIDTHTFLKNEC